MMTNNPAERASELLDCARSKPDAVDPQMFDDLLTSEKPQARRYAIDGLQLLATQRLAVLDDRVEKIDSMMTDSNRQVRASATDVFAEDLDAATVVNSVHTLVGLLDDDFPIVRWNALKALIRAAREDPDTCRVFVDSVVPFLEADTDRIRTHAVMFFSIISKEHPETVLPVADQLFEILLSDVDDAVRVEPSMRRDPSAVQTHVERIADEVASQQRDLRQAASYAICEMAKAEPVAVVSEINTMVALLDDPDPQIRYVVLNTLSVIADEYPRTVAEHTDAIVALLDDDYAGAMVRAEACQVLTSIGAYEPDTVTAATISRIEAIQRLLDSDEVSVRASAIHLLALVIDHDSDAIAPELCDLRDDDIELVRNTAADVLDDR